MALWEDQERRGRNNGVKRKGPAFIVISVGWILLGMIWLASSWNYTIPRWIPPWLFVIGVSTFEVVLLLGWILPLAIGLRLLKQTKQKSK